MSSPWKDAQSVADLGELTAQWLEGRIRRHPGSVGRGGPDKETRHLVCHLAAINRAGFATSSSQPGLPMQRGYRNRPFRQRAAVNGYITNQALLNRITDAATRAGIKVINYQPGSKPRQGIGVTEVNGIDCTWFGNWFGLDEHLATDWHGVGKAAISELRTATYLAVIDPEWGRDTLLWPTLERATKGAR